MHTLSIPLPQNVLVIAGDAKAELQTLRSAIDGVDDALTALLACRATLSRQAQAVKREAGLPVFDRNREESVQERYEQAAQGSGAIAAAIMEWCRSCDS